MIDVPGIAAQDLADIERDQFVYFTEMERHLGDPANWTSFRAGLALAIRTALGLDVTNGDSADTDDARARTPEAILETAWQSHDPAVDWDRFIDRVWNDRSALLDQ